MATHITITNSTSLSKAPSQPSHAYVTSLPGNGDYVKGVVGLAKGLRKAKSKYPLVVAILPDVPEEHRKILVEQGCIVREIEPVYPPENSTQFAMAYCVINYSKLRIWEFVEYSKMVYLDGAIQVFENIDHLFNMPDGHFYAVMDSFCEKTWSHTPRYEIGYCQQCPEKVEWPAELGPKPALYFNGGMFVFEPSIPTYHDLLNTLKTTPPTPFAEQDFLSMFFKDIYRPIPPICNLVLAMPWRYTGKELNVEMDDICNDESLDYKNYSSAAGSEAEAEAEADEEEVTFLQEIREAVGGCCNEDLNLIAFLAGFWEAADCCFIENLNLQPFIEALWETGCGYVEDLCSLPEQFSGGFIFMGWF